MKITPDMPLEPGGAVETHGALIDLADFEDTDGTGVKATSDGGTVRLKVDSYSTTYARSAWLDPDDAEALGQLLIARAAECRKAAAA